MLEGISATERAESTEREVKKATERAERKEASGGRNNCYRAQREHRVS